MNSRGQVSKDTITAYPATGKACGGIYRPTMIPDDRNPPSTAST